MHKISYLSGVLSEIIIDTRRAKESELYPVKYRITFKRKQVYYNSGISVTKDDWDLLWTSRKTTFNEPRRDIDTGYEKICNHIKFLTSIDSDGFSFEALNNRLKGGITSSVVTAMLEKSQAYRNNGQIGTADWYKYSAISIQKFAERDVKFSDITIDWLKRYEKYMVDAGRSLTTISMHVRALQGILNDGLNQGMITQSQYPLGKNKYKIRQGSGRKKALTLSQIKEILDFQELDRTGERCRDLWYFSYLCNGINMNDLCRLKYSNIDDGEIRYHRQKTINTTSNLKEIVATMQPQMLEIINRWGNPFKEQGNFIFPFFSEKMTPTDEKRTVKNVTRLINKKMNDIGKALAFGPISTYSARHSYATVLKRSGVNIAFISEGLGHSDLKTTENYLASFGKEERAKNAAFLTEF